MTVYQFKLSTTAVANQVELIRVRQDDDESQIFRATIFEDGKVKNLNGVSAEFNMVDAQHHIVVDDARIVDATNGIVEYQLRKEAMLSVGRCNAYFSFKSNKEVVYSTKDFNYNVIWSALSSPMHQGCDYVWTASDLIDSLKDWIEHAMGDFDDWFESVKEILASIDPGGVILNELLDARVDLEGKSHTTLYDRLLSDFLRLQNVDSDLGVRSVKNANLICKIANQAGVAIKKINKDKTHSIAIASNSTTPIKLRTANTVAKDFKFGWEKHAYQVPIKNKFLLQGIYDDDNNKYTYYSYSQGELMWIERFDNFNNYIDRMHLPLGGHATDFFVTTESGVDYVWNQVGEQIQNGIKNHFCKIKYAAKTVNYGDTEVVAEFDVFQNYKADANLDAEKDVISIIFNRGTDFLIENRKFSEWQKGIDNILGAFVVKKTEYHAVHQSIDVLDNMIFWHYGETRRDINATGKHGVVVFTLDGKRISSYEIDVTKLISNDAIDGYYEPEGFTVKRTDVPNVYELCFGFATSGKTTYKSWRSSIHAVAIPDFNDEFQIELKSENGIQKQTFTLPEKIASDRLLVDTAEPFNFAKLEKSTDFTGYEQRQLSEIDVIKLIKQYTNKTDYETVLFKGNAGITGAKVDIAGNFKDFDEIKVLYNTSVANHAVQTYASLDRSANVLVLNTINADDAIAGVSQIRECTIDISTGTSFMITQQIATELLTNVTNFKAEEFKIMKITGINKL